MGLQIVRLVDAESAVEPNTEVRSVCFKDEARILDLEMLMSIPLKKVSVYGITQESGPRTESSG